MTLAHTHGRRLVRPSADSLVCLRGWRTNLLVATLLGRRRRLLLLLLLLLASPEDLRARLALQ